MPSHAELTRNYYHIIDPEGNLSECERAQRENEILDSMPVSFPDALCYVMKIAKATKESLAYEAGVSESTIGRYRTGEDKPLFLRKNCCALRWYASSTVAVV